MALTYGTLTRACGLLAEHGVSVPRELHFEMDASEILVAHNRDMLGAIIVADSLPREAREAVDALGRMHLSTVLLTGDTVSVAKSVAGTLGIAEVHADLLPGDERAMVDRLVKRGRVVAMLGDGINDAPALTAVLPTNTTSRSRRA